VERAEERSGVGEFEYIEFEYIEFEYIEFEYIEKK